MMSIKENVKKNEHTKRQQLRNDLLFFGVLIGLTALYFGWKVRTPSEVGAEIFVEMNGKEYARYPLWEDGEYDITNGVSHNVLVIKEGKASVTHASCPDGLCIHQADISKNGEMIVCLPNQVVITVVGSEESELDAVAK